MSEEKKQKSDEIKEFGALMLNENKKNYKIRLLTIIGEIEGHETVSNNTKATSTNIYFHNWLKLKKAMK